MTTVTFSANVQAAGGPQLSVNRTIEVEAYDRIQVKLDPGGTSATAVEVQIQPSVAAKVAIIALTSDLFGQEITYVISDGTATGNSAEIKLDQPQVFTGDAIKLFGADPKTIKLKNKFAVTTPIDPTKTAQVVIFVGRKAT